MLGVLVIGAGGQLGPSLCSALQNAGYAVCRLSRSAVPGDSLVLPSPWSVDLLKDALQGRQIEAIVNLAGAGVRPGDDQSAVLFDANIVLPGKLVEVAASLSCALINIGSGAEYRGSPGHVALPETTALNIDHPYGWSKAAGGLTAYALARARDVPFMHLRLFGAYGENEAPHRLLPMLFDRLSRDQPVSLSDGRQIRDWLYEGDVASALVAAVKTLQRKSVSGLFNLGSGEGHSVREFAGEVAAIMEADPALLRFGDAGRRGSEVDSLVADCTRLRSTVAWVPEFTWRRGLAHAIGRLRERHSIEGK